MAGTRRGYSPRRAGEVVDVQVDRSKDRPVTIWLYEHHHRYEVAWTHSADGSPIVVDLRICSDDEVPITSNALKRINVERLARAAARHDTDEATRRGREMREALAAALGESNPAQILADALEWLDAQGAVSAVNELRRATAQTGPDTLLADGLAGVEARRFTDGVVDAMVRHAPPGVTPPKRRGGRPPKWSQEFLAQATAWALEAHEDGNAIYPYVAARASEATGADYDEDNAKWWIKRAKQTGLLAPDQLGRPPKSQTHQQHPQGD
ncbi:MAG: hypothetical protein ACLP9Y_06260 [Mycobacterium sp.]